MAMTQPSPVTGQFTYEQYMAEGEVDKRYDILDGVRIFMPGPKWRHQRIQVNVIETLRAYERTSGKGVVVPAPFDVLIGRKPLRTRQPDVLFISHEQLKKGGGIPEAGPLEVAPELVVEIISDSERQNMIDGKLADYSFLGVREAWLIRPDTRTVEVCRLTHAGTISEVLYEETQTVQSLAFPDLKVSAVELFQV